MSEPRDGFVIRRRYCEPRRGRPAYWCGLNHGGFQVLPARDSWVMSDRVKAIHIARALRKVATAENAVAMKIVVVRLRGVYR